MTPRKIEPASAVTVGGCDFCPAVHVNLLDADGAVFATASVPAAQGEEFIRRFRAAISAVNARHPAPAVQQ